MERMDRCPVCKQRNVLMLETYHEKNKVKDNMECSDRKATWQNIYTFSHHHKIAESVWNS